MKLDQWPTYCTCATDERLTLETSALGTPYSGQFTLSTQFTKPHYLVIPLFSPFPSPSPSPPPPTPTKAALRKLPLLFKRKLTLSLSHTQKLLDWEFSTLIIPPIFFRISRNHNTLNRYSNREHRKRRKIILLIM